MVQTKLTIQVQIGNRSYPITVAAAEKDGVLNAAEKINKQIKELETAYKVTDQQDLLAMCVLQMSSEQLKASMQRATSSDEVHLGLKELDARVTDYLDQI